MVDLPNEVWLLIAQHLSSSTILQLMPTNRALLNIALDRKYRSIEWVHLDNKIAKSLERLQDPYVAVRVRHLHIRAWFLQYLLQRERLFEQTDLELKSPILGHNITKRFLKLFHWSPPVVGSGHTAVSKRLGKLSSSKEITDTMIYAISLMVNVIEYKFNLDDLTINDATQRLLSSTGQAFSSSLIILILHGRISQLSHFMPFANFYQLEKLVLRFDYDPGDENAKDDIRKNNALTLITSIAPFINSLSSSLRCLSITSFGNADHSPFLDALGPLPKLNSLALHLSFAKGHFSSSGPISRLLHIHKSTLEMVEVSPHPPERLPDRPDHLSMTPPYYPSRDPDVVRTEAAMAEQWVEDPAWLRNIQFLSIPAFEHLMTCRMLRQMPPSCLRSLSLKGRYMTLSELQEALVALEACEGLDALSIEVVQLSPNLIQFLAQKLPNLRSLTLILGVYFYTILTPGLLLLPEYHSCRRLDWTLSDLSIYFMQAHDSSISASPETRAEQNLMRQLKDFILPNVESFKGRGHMETEYLY